MRTFSILLIVFLSISSIAVAQISIGIFSGYGRTTIDDNLITDLNNETEAAYLPSGAQVAFGFNLDPSVSVLIGAELDYAAIPSTYGVTAPFILPDVQMRLIEYRISQLYYGGLLKVKFLDGIVKPFVRAGAGMYSGKFEFNFMEVVSQFLEDVEENTKQSFGFNVGGGVDLKTSESISVFFEFVYHFVDREVEFDDLLGQPLDLKYKSNNWAGHVGLQIMIQ